eukprot:1159649-Pelagomonas_calceolata.AAC.7
MSQALRFTKRLACGGALCSPGAALHPAKIQLSNALSKSWNGAGGAEICQKAVSGRTLSGKGWASHGDDL